MKWTSNFPERFAELVGDEPYREVAVKLNISKATVGAYLNAKREPKRPVLLSIAAYYGVDPVWLMGGDTPKYKDPEAQKSPGTVIDAEGLSEDKRKLVDYVMSLSEEEVRLLRRMFDNSQTGK